MFRLKPATWDELREKAAANYPASPAQAMAEGPRPRPNNVRAILDLGTLIFFQWRGRSFGIPPVPWKKGAQLLDAYLEARSYGNTLTRDTSAGYYKALGRMSKVMWQCSYPVGRVLRFFRLIRLYRNPYRNATEGELAELAVFFLGRRMNATGLRVPVPDQKQTT